MTHLFQRTVFALLLLTSVFGAVYAGGAENTAERQKKIAERKKRNAELEKKVQEKTKKELTIFFKLLFREAKYFQVSRVILSFHPDVRESTAVTIMGYFKQAEMNIRFVKMEQRLSKNGRRADVHLTLVRYFPEKPDIPVMEEEWYLVMLKTYERWYIARDKMIRGRFCDKYKKFVTEKLTKIEKARNGERFASLKLISFVVEDRVGNTSVDAKSMRTPIPVNAAFFEKEGRPIALRRTLLNETSIVKAKAELVLSDPSKRKTEKETEDNDDEADEDKKSEKSASKAAFEKTSEENYARILDAVRDHGQWYREEGKKGNY